MGNRSGKDAEQKQIDQKTEVVNCPYKNLFGNEG